MKSLVIEKVQNFGYQIFCLDRVKDTRTLIYPFKANEKGMFCYSNFDDAYIACFQLSCGAKTICGEDVNILAHENIDESDKIAWCLKTIKESELKK